MEYNEYKHHTKHPPRRMTTGCQAENDYMHGHVLLRLSTDETLFTIG